MPKEETQHRVVRVVLAALLDSDLTVRELRRFADTLAKGDASRSLAGSIRALVAHLEAEAPQIRREAKKPSPLVEEVINTIRRRKISKADVLILLRDCGGSKVESGADLTVRNIVADFYRAASPSQFQEFVAKVQGGGGGDPFLKGITRR